jgi:type II secretory pathway component PulF
MHSRNVYMMLASFSIRDQMLFMRQLASLLTAGLSLLEALHLIMKCCPKNWRSVLRSIIVDLNHGESLSGSLSKYRDRFSPICISLIAISEKTGLLAQSLILISKQLEAQESLGRQMKQALTYPCITLGSAFLIILAMMIWVIPSFEDIFLNFKAELPMSTQLLISIARFLETNIEFILLFGVILVVVFAFVWTKSLYIQKWCDYHLFALPFFGKLLRLSAQMTWCRNLAYLLDSGLGALDAIRITGEALDRCDPRGQFFDPETKHLLGIGAKTGTLAEMLHSRHQTLECDLSHQLAILNQSLEPILILALGLMIGGLLMTLYLPIFSLGKII